MIGEFISNFLAKRLVRWVLIAGINAIGIASVAGIPVVLIIDAFLIFSAIKGGVEKATPIARKGGSVIISSIKFLAKALLYLTVVSMAIGLANAIYKNLF